MKRFVLSFESWLNESRLDEAVPMVALRPFMNLERDEVTKTHIENFMQAIENTCNGSFRNRNKFRIYIPANDLDFSNMTSFIKNDIQTFLNTVNKNGNSVISKASEGDKEYKILDYIGNQIHVPGQKNPTKLTKVLQKLGRKDLADAYCADPLRDGAKSLKENKLIVISDHFYDIVGMSSGRDWTSCMDILNQPEKVKAEVVDDDDFDEEDEIEAGLDGDEEIEWEEGSVGSHYEVAKPRAHAIENIKHDIEHGTIVAYLILESDKNIEKPLARILLKPYALLPNGDEEDIEHAPIVYFPEQTIYGLRITSFRKKMIDICNKAQKELKSAWQEIWLKPNDNLYNDYATPKRNQNFDTEHPDKKEIFDPENVQLGDDKYKEAMDKIHLNREGKLI